MSSSYTYDVFWADGMTQVKGYATWYEIPKHLNHSQRIGYLREFALVSTPGISWYSAEKVQWEQEGKEYYELRRREVLLETEMPKDLVLLIESFIQ